jgi:hypothetical protein
MKPQSIDDVTLAFPARVKHLMPSDDAPGYAPYREDWHNGSSWGFKLFNDWFYQGLSKLEMKPKHGVETKKDRP